MQKRITVSIIAIVIILTSLVSCADKDMLNKQNDSAAGSDTVTQNNTSHESSSDPTATEPSTDAMTDTDSNTEITSDEVTEPVTSLEAAIKTVKDEVDSKGWIDIEVIEGDPDSRNRWNIVIKPHIISEGEVLYTVIGKSEHQLYDNPFHVVVAVVYNETSNEWRKEEVYYICKGRSMYDATLKNIFPEEYETKEILTADNEKIYQFMYSY